MKCSETQNVDLANKVKGNHYLRHVDHRSTHKKHIYLLSLPLALSIHNKQTNKKPVRFMSNQTSKDTELDDHPDAPRWTTSFTNHLGQSGSTLTQPFIAPTSICSFCLQLSLQRFIINNADIEVISCYRVKLRLFPATRVTLQQGYRLSPTLTDYILRWDCRTLWCPRGNQKVKYQF